MVIDTREMEMTALKLSDINRKDAVVLIDGTTGIVFSTGTTKATVIMNDGRTLLVTPDQIKTIKR